MAAVGLTFDHLAPNISRGFYAGSFESHLQRLMTIDLSAHRAERAPIITLSQRRYRGMEQTAFELSRVYEITSPNEIDWKRIEGQVSLASEKIKELIVNDLTSDLIQPLVRQTLHTYENFLIYNDMYPNSRINPWSPTLRIIQSGILLGTSDDESFLREFNSKITLTRYKRQGPNLAVIVKGQPKRFGIMPLDNKYSAQTLVFQYLFTKAKGIVHSKSLTEIDNYLRSVGISFDNTNNIQILVTTPLKKTGLIGSTINGFFYIETADDLKAAFEFHHVKSKSILQVMDRYRQRQKEFKDLDLDSMFDEE